MLEFASCSPQSDYPPSPRRQTVSFSLANSRRAWLRGARLQRPLRGLLEDPATPLADMDATAFHGLRVDPRMELNDRQSRLIVLCVGMPTQAILS
jgi:hypothetical protein